MAPSRLMLRWSITSSAHALHAPALVALIHVLSTVATDSGVGRDGGAAAWALQGLGGSLVILVEI